MEAIAKRSEYSRKRLEILRNSLSAAEKIVSDTTCVYAIGSYGREEAGEHSDIDLYIVCDENNQNPVLGPLDEICLKADLISAARRHNFPEFDAGGKYLVSYTVNRLVGTLGMPEDDAENTFTARLLLLLESQALLGSEFRFRAIEEVLASYWRDYADHQEEFVPAFLVNDIIRLWRTFCVNYEARTSESTQEKRSKRKLKNYKLKHSRMMTCYSAIVYMLHVFSRTGTVTPVAAREMCSLTPVQRFQRVASGVGGDEIGALLESYSQFLDGTDHSEEHLIEKITSGDADNHFREQANQFSERMFNVLSTVGADDRFKRLVML